MPRSPKCWPSWFGAGVDVFRLNMAHGKVEDYDLIVRDIRQIGRQMQRALGVLVDLAGPKIRLGVLVEDPTECTAGERV
ncbi:Pyruvate kinase [Lignipirellula cremea]|uniref:Pyruvate kinase n=1 Tax=Lignipirellula cremea TaxID=2528010 RepID=A0A518DPS9_9BACT|nr:Pyruvate kinase [Lignipirellula cremea]